MSKLKRNKFNINNKSKSHGFMAYSFKEGFFERLRIIAYFFGNAKSGIDFHLIKLQTLLVPSQVWGAFFDGKHR